jgi:hypothetical protein
MRGLAQPIMAESRMVALGRPVAAGSSGRSIGSARSYQPGLCAFDGKVG